MTVASSGSVGCVRIVKAFIILYMEAVGNF